MLLTLMVPLDTVKGTLRLLTGSIATQSVPTLRNMPPEEMTTPLLPTRRWFQPSPMLNVPPRTRSPPWICSSLLRVSWNWPPRTYTELDTVRLL